MGTVVKAIKEIKTEIKQLVDNGNKQQSEEIEDILEKQKVNNEIINRNVKKGNGCVWEWKYSREPKLQRGWDGEKVQIDQK